MTKNEYVEKLEEYIINTGTVTFAEIERKWPDLFGGKLVLSLPDLSALNIYLWFNMSELGVDVFQELQRRKKIRPLVTSIFTYVADGIVPTVKVVGKQKITKRYKNERWLPVCFSRA